MSNAEGIHPTRIEIERQLERMLAHPMFEAQEQRAKIFKYLVKNALRRRKVNELGLFRRFYKLEQWEKHSTKVRTTVSQMRKDLLAKYYAEDGKDDPVIIALPAPERSHKGKKNYKIVRRPPGDAYKPTFAYNPRSRVARQFAIANFLLRGGPSQISMSLWRFAEIFSVEPRHPDVLLGFAEALGSHLLLGLCSEEQRGKFIAEAFQITQGLDPATADPWRIHNVRGLLHTCAGELDMAGKEFDHALKLDRQATVSRGSYVFFLFETGKREEALRLFSLVVDEQASNPQAHAVYGIYLNKAGHYEEAERALSQALSLDRNCWPAHLGMTQLYAATGKREKVREHAKRLEALVEPAEYEEMMRRLKLKHSEGRTR
jgi:tetratricopeptide (TPR) repeat protein